MTGTQSLLCEMLSCGTLDLELLDRVGYDWDEVLEQLDWPDGEGFTFNGLMRAVVGVGIYPDQDIEGFFNCLDTHVWFRQNGPVYRRYLSSALDSFEDNVGFFLTGGED